MPEFQRYSPENLGNNEKTQKVLKVKNLASELLSIKANDEEAWIKKSGIVRDMFEATGYGATSIQGLNEVEKDENKTDKQKEMAREAKDVLITGMYEGMLDTNNEELEMALGTGNISKIEAELPKDFKGTGREIIHKVTGDLKITETLVELDNSRQRNKNKGELGKKQFDKKLEDAYVKIDEMEELSESGKKGQELVMTYLSMESEGINEKESEKNENTEIPKNGKDESKMEEYARQNAEYARRSAEYAQRRFSLEGDVEKVSLGEILDSYLKIKAPRERAPQMWEYEIPPFMGWNQEEKQEDWRKLLSFEDAWLGAVYSKRADSAYNNSLDKMKDGILSMKSLSEADFKKWYEDDTLNLKGVMHQISRELLIKKQITQGSLSRDAYVFDTVINAKGEEEYVKESRVEEFVNNEDTYKMGLVERLVKNKVVKNEQIAKLAVSLSMDIMEMGGVFSEADGLRKLSWESDALRLAQRPERKFTSKVSGGELFAGPWTELANILSKGDFKEAAKKVKSWEVVPELLAGSFLDQKLELDNGKKTEKTMMEMIYNDEKIQFGEKENDLFFKWRKDHVMPAARIWMYITNKTPLEFSKQREFDNVISEWRSDLFNDINQLRKNGDAMLPTSVVEGAIGGSIGLWPFAGPYLRIGSTQDPDRNKNYVTYCEEIFRAMGLSESEKNQIKNFFGVDRKYMFDFGDKVVDLKAAQNMNSSKKFKNEMWSEKHLLKERKNK